MVTKYSVECWVFSPERQVLLLQVGARPGKHEAFWQPVTGGIEQGEQAIGAALREIAEETQLRLREDDLSRVRTGFTVEISPELTISKTIYIARAPHTTVATNPEEHIAHRWLAAAEVPSTLYWASNRETWELVEAYQQSTAANHDP